MPGVLESVGLFGPEIFEPFIALHDLFEGLGLFPYRPQIPRNANAVHPANAATANCFIKHPLLEI